MGSVTIRRLADVAKHNARLAATSNGRSLEAELRALIEQTYGGGDDAVRAQQIRAMSSAAFIDHLIKVANGAELVVPERSVGQPRDIFGAD